MTPENAHPTDIGERLARSIEQQLAEELRSAMVVAEESLNEPLPPVDPATLALVHAHASDLPLEVDTLVPIETTDGDGGIPMLTDVLHPPRYPASELPTSLAQVDWAAFSQRVQDNVLERLMRRSDAMLAASLHQTLGVVLERATRSLALELEDVLSRSIRELVARAVSDELNRVHAEINRRAAGKSASPDPGAAPVPSAGDDQGGPSAAPDLTPGI